MFNAHRKGLGYTRLLPPKSFSQLLSQYLTDFLNLNINLYLGGFSKRYSLKLSKKASFCHKKA